MYCKVRKCERQTFFSPFFEQKVTFLLCLDSIKANKHSRNLSTWTNSFTSLSYAYVNTTTHAESENGPRKHKQTILILTTNDPAFRNLHAFPLSFILHSLSEDVATVAFFSRPPFAAKKSSQKSECEKRDSRSEI